MKQGLWLYRVHVTLRIHQPVWVRNIYLFMPRDAKSAKKSVLISITELIFENFFKNPKSNWNCDLKFEEQNCRTSCSRKSYGIFEGRFCVTATPHRTWIMIILQIVGYIWQRSRKNKFLKICRLVLQLWYEKNVEYYIIKKVSHMIPKL